MENVTKQQLSHPTEDDICLEWFESKDTRKNICKLETISNKPSTKLRSLLDKYSQLAELISSSFSFFSFSMYFLLSDWLKDVQKNAVI